MAYPSNSSDSVAQDQIKAFVRRIESIEDELAALNADKSEIYKEARSNGFDTKQMRKVVAKRKVPAVERDEQDIVFDLYWDAVHGVAHAHVENIEQFGADKAQKEVQTAPKQLGQPEARLAAAATLPVETKAVGISAPIPEPQPPQPAGQELDADTTMLGVEHPIQPETAPAGEVRADERPSPKPEDAASRPNTHAATYPDPGIVTWESCPSVGVVRHEYSAAFGTAGQDIAVIEDDMSNAASAPIQMIGNVVLDGWARYLKARELGIEYPVEQYAGSDPLIDCIKWNAGGRLMTSEQSFRVAQALTKLTPKRKAEIYAAMEIGMELVA